jgi:hypothetical protein
VISNEEERRAFFKDVCFAPDHLIRDWAAVVAATWDAMDARESKAIPADTRSNDTYGAAHAIIQEFVLRDTLGVQQSPEILHWLAEALQRILRHKDPLHSLGLLPRPKHRPADPQPSIDVVWWVRCAERLGYESVEAKALASEAFFKDPKTIGRYLESARECADSMNSDLTHWVRYFESRNRPLPPSVEQDKK